MKSNFATLGNFSIKDRIGKIRILNHINFHLKDSTIFPRDDKRNEKFAGEMETKAILNKTQFIETTIEVMP